MKVVVSALVLVIGLSSCLGLPRQEASFIFTNGRLPNLLDSIANPKPTLTDYQSADLSSLRVAVIDAGVDYLHPYLKNRIAFEKNANQEITAGYDFLADDAYPHPNQIDPSTFALGATVIDGKISNPKNDPLQYLDEVNQKFIELLTSNTAKYKAPTWFKNMITKEGRYENIHVLGARKVYLTLDEIISDYKEKLKNSKIVKSNTPFYKNDEYSKTQYLYFKQGRFTMNNDGLPDPSYYSLSQLEDYDTVAKLIRYTYQETLKHFPSFESDLKAYFDYKDAEDRKAKNNDVISQQLQYMGDLVSAWQYRFWGKQWNDHPLRDASTSLCSYYAGSQWTEKLGTLKAQDRFNMIQSEIQSSFNSLIKYQEFLLQSDFLSAFEKHQKEKEIQNLKKAIEFARTEIKAENFPLLDCTQSWRMQSVLINKDNHSLAQSEESQNNPYLDKSSSLDNSHGTHVSGIVAAQDDALSIVPIKVVTETLSTSEEQDRTTKANLKPAFKAWLDSPLVSQAIQIQYQDEASPMLREFDLFFDDLFDSKKLDIYFVNSVLKAIQYTAKEKIKVANISLGANFNRNVSNTKKSKDANWKEAYEFLLFEYFKYMVSQSLTQDAPQTIFVVAAGNDGSWLDGKSKSAIPCDLSSPFLESVKNANQSIPNSKIENLVCVLSASEKNELSPYTNLPLTDTPLVVARGEAFPSLVRLEDCSGTNQEITEEFGNLSYPDSNKKMLETYLNKTLSPDEIADESQRIFGAYKVVLDLFQAAARRQCLEGGEHKKFTAKMSGTSMASPVVSGYLGSLIVKKLSHLGVSESSAYDSAEFSPKKIINETLNSCVPFGGNTIAKDLAVVPKVEICRIPNDGVKQK